VWGPLLARHGRPAAVRLGNGLAGLPPIDRPLAAVDDDDIGTPGGADEAITLAVAVADPGELRLLAQSLRESPPERRAVVERQQAWFALRPWPGGHGGGPADQIGDLGGGRFGDRLEPAVDEILNDAAADVVDGNGDRRRRDDDQAGRRSHESRPDAQAHSRS